MSTKNPAAKIGGVLLSVVMILALLFPGMAQARGEENSVFNPSNSSYSASQSDDYSKIFVKNKTDNISAYSKNDKVHVVIKMKDKSLLEEPSMKTYSSVKKYLSSSKAQKRQQSLLKSQNQVIKKANSDNIDIQFRYQYTDVFNGIGAIVKYGDIDKLSSLDGVDKVFVSQKYKTIEPMLNDSTQTIGSTAVNATGYTGKNTVTAIIDTGLDMSHEAFQGAVNNPKYSKSDIANTIKNKHLTIGTLSVDVVYHSSKVPYAFDYADNNYNVSGGDSHGTHVAGITGANSGGVIKGVAPDTQLLIMKVFGDGSAGAYDESILAALDDAVKIGCDNINMSLGTSCGFSEDSDENMRGVYKRVQDAGIDLICAAGNDYSSSYHGNSKDDLPLASNPDNSTLSSPSSYEAAVSVASVNNNESRDPYFTVGSEKIRYLDSAETETSMFTSLSGTFEYVDCKDGGSEAFKNVDVKNKIALIERGGEENGEILTFSQKEANAVKAGAIAAVVYDNVENSLVSMATDHNIPMVFISREDGKKMLSSKVKELVANPDFIGAFTDAYSGKMSDFSSWGVTPDLKLKPEITAPGGNIYSSLPNNKYGTMSGTSMASPHMAGAAAVMEQYANEQLDATDMTQQERTKLINDIMLSTAAQVTDEDGNTVSPRKQGAGLVQLQNAVKAQAYLSSDSNGGKPVISMGDNEDGEFGFDFFINPLGSKSDEYKIDVDVMTERTVEKDGKKYMAQKDRLLDSSEVTVTAPASIRTSSKAKELSVKISLTEKGKEKLKNDFKNGIFIEGYVKLTPSDSSKASLSLPFMGFFGNWSYSPLFDKTIYSGEEAAITPMYLGVFDDYDGSGYKLGHNVYGNADIYDANKIAVKGNDTSSHITAVSTLFRNAEKLEYSATDSSGENVYLESQSNVQKSYYSSSEGYYQPFADEGWKQKDVWNDPLSDGRYTYTVKGYLTSDAKTATDSVSFPVTIDSENPQIVKSEVKGDKWTVTVKDNHYVQAVGVTTGSTPLTGWINPDEKEPGAETTVTFDLSDPAFKGVEQAKIAIVDYADNQVVSEAYNISNASRYYRTGRGDSDWSKASAYDTNNDGIIDVEDLVANEVKGKN